MAFTAILGHLITLPAVTLVSWRTTIAAAVIFLILRPKAATHGHPYRLKSFLTGIILGAHWMTFFGAVKISNISICLTGMATASLFTAIVEAIQEKRKPRPSEIILGLIIIPAIALIAGIETAETLGLLTALASALLAAIFSVINKSLVRRGTPALSITQYSMLGASITCLLTSIAFQYPLGAYIPTSADWIWLSILAIVCTVYAYSLNIKLLGHFSAFETNLAINFEPVYGIILAAVLFQEHQQLHPLFFLGAFFIIIANFAQPLIRRWRKAKHRPAPTIPL